MHASERARWIPPLCGMLAALAAAGCQDSRAEIFIQQVNLPVPGAAGGGCKVDSTPTNPTTSTGTLDLAFGVGYQADFLVGSQLVARGDRLRARAETDRVELQGAEVRIEDASGNEVRGFRSVPSSGSIDPGTDVTPSFGLMNVTLLDTNFIFPYAGVIQATGPKTFLTYSRAYGTTTGGTFVESGEFLFPINVCWGCLITFPPDANDPGGASQPNCDNTMATSSTTTCSPGQDSLVDCRVCQTTVPAANRALCEPSR